LSYRIKAINSADLFWFFADCGELSPRKALLSGIIIAISSTKLLIFWTELVKIWTPHAIINAWIKARSRWAELTSGVAYRKIRTRAQTFLTARIITHTLTGGLILRAYFHYTIKSSACWIWSIIASLTANIFSFRANGIINDVCTLLKACLI